MTFEEIADDKTIEITKLALEKNGFKVTIADDQAVAKDAALALIPKGAEVLTMTSVTLDDSGITSAINESGDYDSVRAKLNSDLDKREKRRIGAAPDYAVGSVHAITQDGELLIASATGSQLPAYAYGAGHVVWVVGAQKIVKDMYEANRRLREHTFPLEDERSKKAYGMGSGINKILIMNKEVQPDRIDLIIIKEPIGF